MRRAAPVWAGLVLQAATAALAQPPATRPPSTPTTAPPSSPMTAPAPSKGLWERSATMPTPQFARENAQPRGVGGAGKPGTVPSGAAGASGASAPGRLPGALTGARAEKGPKETGPQVTNFSPEAVELRGNGQRWLLVAGDKVLKDFGRYEAEGREAVRVIRQLKLDGYGAVGSPPVMEFWLAGGAAPKGPVTGAAAVAFDPLTLTVRQDQGEWVLRDGQRVLFTFGPFADSAWDALRVIQQHGFGQVAMVGQARPMMQVFLAGSGSGVVPAGFTGGGQQGLQGGVPGGQQAGLGAAGAAGRMASPGGMGGGLAGGSSGGMMAQAGAVGLTGPEVFPTAPRFGSAGAALQPGAQGLPGSLTAMKVPGMAGTVVPGVGDLGNRVPFDSRQLQVRRDGDGWKLVLGPYVMASFGTNEGEARRARQALQYYRCSEQVLVGGSPPVFSFFLAGGRAPQGATIGVTPREFRPESLTVVSWQGQQVITDGSQVLFAFGDKALEARQALRAIQQHGFDGIVRFGEADGGLTLLVKTR